MKERKDRKYNKELKKIYSCANKFKEKVTVQKKKSM